MSVTNYGELMELVPEGRENAVSRSELRMLAGISDRKCRRFLQEAKEHEELIVNLQDGKGYFRPGTDDIKSIAAQYKLNQSRMISLSKQQKNLRRILKEAGAL